MYVDLWGAMQGAMNMDHAMRSFMSSTNGSCRESRIYTESARLVLVQMLIIYVDDMLMAAATTEKLAVHVKS